MTAPIQVIAGQRFERWTVLHETPKRPGRHFLCKCQCGIEREVHLGHLRSGHSRSCGCISYELPNKLRHGHSMQRGGRGTPTYITWLSMRQRCSNPHNVAYPNYGGRGIKVCERWEVFDYFLADMGARPSKAHTIDRYPDNDGNYEPGNCRWATASEQQRNKRKPLPPMTSGEIQKFFNLGFLACCALLLQTGKEI